MFVMKVADRLAGALHESHGAGRPGNEGDEQSHEREGGMELEHFLCLGWFVWVSALFVREIKIKKILKMRPAFKKNEPQDSGTMCRLS